MFEHGRKNRIMSGLIAICVILILLSLALVTGGSEPDTPDDEKIECEQEICDEGEEEDDDDECSSSKGEITEDGIPMDAHPTPDDVAMRYEVLKTRLETVLEIIEQLHEDMKDGELAGTDLEPFWNEYWRGVMELEYLEEAMEDGCSSSLKEIIEELEGSLAELEEELSESESDLQEAQEEWEKLCDEKAEKEKELKRLKKMKTSLEEEIEELLDKIEDRRRRGLSTKLLEIKLADAQEGLEKLVEEISELCGEIAELELMMGGIKALIATLEDEIGSIETEMTIIRDDLVVFEQLVNDCMEEEEEKDCEIEKLLKIIRSKLKKLETRMEHLRKKRGANDEDAPEVMIEVEIVSLELKTVEPILIVDVIGTDVTEDPDELVHAESALFTYSLDGKVWYVSGFTTMDDSIAVLEGQTHHPAVTCYRVTMTNWYGNHDSDETCVKHVYEPTGKLSIHGEIASMEGIMMYDATWVQSVDSFFDVFVEVDLPGLSGPAGSFFDVFTEFGLGGDAGAGGSIFPAELFFDVFVELTLEDLQEPNFDMNIIMDLNEEGEDNGGVSECPTCGAELAEGETTCPKCGGELVEEDDQLELSLYIESFFDVFVEVDLPGLYFPPDSFFDISYETSMGYEKGKLKFGTKVGTHGNCAVDSFFDVFVEVDLPGMDLAVESFFDVFCEMYYTYSSNSVATGPISPPPEDIVNVQGFMKGGLLGAVMGGLSSILSTGGTGEPYDFHYYTLALYDCDFHPGGGEIKCLECGEWVEPTLTTCPTCGGALEPMQSSLYHIDSFFDVFTELGYQSDSFFDVYCEGSLTFNGRGIDLNEDSFFDVFVEVDIDTLFPSGPAKGAGISTSVDMAYQCGDGLYHIDSFFDVFTWGADRTISAASYDFSMDIGTVMGVEPSPFIVESFFDVFVESRSSRKIVARFGRKENSTCRWNKGDRY